MASPAVCEVGGCGVLAVGRCRVCDRAFCGSHRADGAHLLLAATRSDLVPNVCTACAGEARADSADRQARRVEAQRRARNEGDGVLREFVAAATAARWPWCQLVVEERLVTAERRTALGRTKPAVHDRVEHPGYLLGTSTWIDDHYDPDVRALWVVPGGLLWTSDPDDGAGRVEVGWVSSAGTPSRPEFPNGWRCSGLDFARAEKLGGGEPRLDHDWFALYVWDRLRAIASHHRLDVRIPDLVGA